MERFTIFLTVEMSESQFRLDESILYFCLCDGAGGKWQKKYISVLDFSGEREIFASVEQRPTYPHSLKFVFYFFLIGVCFFCSLSKGAWSQKQKCEIFSLKFLFSGEFCGMDFLRY